MSMRVGILGNAADTGAFRLPVTARTISAFICGCPLAPRLPDTPGVLSRLERPQEFVRARVENVFSRTRRTVRDDVSPDLPASLAGECARARVSRATLALRADVGIAVGASRGFGQAPLLVKARTLFRREILSGHLPGFRRRVYPARPRSKSTYRMPPRTRPLSWERRPAQLG